MFKVYVVPEDDSKKAKAKAWVKNRVTDAQCWCSENKELIAVLAPGIIGAVTFGIKAISKHNNIMRQQDLKEKYVYDTSLGHYWELKRKLSNSQWSEIERRRNSGESLGQILASMGVLKGL